jgi:YYY domain-containing protein
MLSPILWYLAISLVGWLTIPLAYRLLPALADRGYAFTRALGLLLWGYIFWLLASLGVLRNDLGGLLFALLVLIALSGWALHGVSLGELAKWLDRQRLVILVVEIVFLVSFAGMAFVRAANPEILGTEKPMELTFINAILNSPVFPPHDPWLSGYAISYYYFGYVMVAMLAKLTGAPGSIAFNLGVTQSFALSAVGAFGLVYYLLIARTAHSGGAAPQSSRRYLSLALLGPVLILLVGNLEGFLEVLHARGLWWQTAQGGEMRSPFWEWLDMRELSEPPEQPFSWEPSRYLWWWRASRVVQDYDYAGNWKEVIDEFPAFSYLLADLHPHVLAMPFAFLAMALTLNLFLGGGAGHLDWLRRRFAVASVRQEPADLSLVAGQAPGVREVGLALEINSPTFLLSAVCLGSLAFLNTWDFPFYLALFAGVYALLRSRDEGAGIRGGIGEFFKMGFIMGVAGILLYLPFYLGFSSQAGGILPNLVYPTRGAHLWVMFAVQLIPIFALLFSRWGPGSSTWRWQGFALALGLALVLWLFSILLAVGITLVPQVSGLFLGSVSAPGLRELLAEAVARRLVNSGGWITLLLLLGLTLGLIINEIRDKGEGDKKAGDKGIGDRETDYREREEEILKSANPSPLSLHPYPLSPDLFVLLMTLLGALLVLGPEFLFLRDLFGWRINTIFKFYYQAWLLWGIVAAYASVVLLQSLRRPLDMLYGVGVALLLGMGLTYTVLGLWTKTNGFKPPMGYTLDGTAYLASQTPDELDAVAWLRNAPAGVVAEAVGGSYTLYGRISTMSGQPTVLGWEFHEVQWRGGGELLGSRKNDIMRLYCARDWVEAEEIIQEYNIRYIFVGGLERSEYSPQACPGGLNEAKFMRSLPVAFQKGETTIYMVP